MELKTIIASLLFFTATTTKAQITPSLTIPNPLPNYDGSYDNFGTNHLFYPNGGEVRFANKEMKETKDVVKFYTMNTYPKKYLMRNNNIAYVHYKAKSGPAGADSLQRIDLAWDGGDPAAFLARVDTQNFAQLNYFTQWFGPAGRTGVKGGAAIACQSIYKNIDLVYTSNNAGLVMYFVVYPGGNYKNILLKIEGATGTSISGTKLKIEAGWEHSTLQQPQMYQYALYNNVIVPVNVGSATWDNAGINKYKISTNSYFNSALPLIIQIKQANAVTADTPGLDWSTYFGGTGQDMLNKTHTDANDNLYVAGYSKSPAISFPQANGVALNPNNNGDAAIAKFNNGGILLWSTFVGNSAWDEFHDFTFKGNSIYCVGKTGSNNIQTQTKAGATTYTTFGGGTWDAFICELVFNPIAQSVQKNWLSYFGGNGDEQFNACKFDGSGNLFVVGAGASTNMAVTAGSGLGAYTQTFNPAQLAVNPLSTDGIIVKFNSSGLQDWFTFYGTNTLGANANSYPADHLYDLAINGTDLYICGKAGGTNLPNSLNGKSNAGAFGGILVRFLTSGQLPTNTAKYTNGNVCNWAVATYGGEVYTVGDTWGAMTTTVNSGQYYFDGTPSGTTDGCFSVHDALLGTTLHNSYLGGNDHDGAHDIEFTSNGLFLIAGGTDSPNFPMSPLSHMYYAALTPMAFYYAGDNFISCFQKGNTNIIWSSGLGSETGESWPPVNFTYDGDDFIMKNTSIALDSQNALYLLGNTASSTTFPLDEWTGNPVYFQPQSNMMDDATITRFKVAPLNAIGVGIEDVKNTEFDFGIYPNPASKFLSISNKGIVTNDLQYVVYDLGGKKLKEGSFKAADVKDIDVSALPQGVYILNLKNGSKTYSSKFVKGSN